MDKTKLGRTIRRIREDAGLSQEAFADKAGVHRTYTGKVERGEVNLTIQNLDKLARALGVKIWQILKEVEG